MRECIKLPNNLMKWYGISGSWRKTNNQVELDVRTVVRKILKNGDGIVTGGALNVDYFAVDEAFKMDPSGNHMKVIIPATLERYAAHYRKRANEGIISSEQAEMLITQLSQVKKANPHALIEKKDERPIKKITYYERNSDIIDVSDELYAFQVNKSLGTQDTIDKAKKKGLPVHIFSYVIE